MVRHAYTVARQVYEQELTVTAGRELLANNYHWDFGSAGDYIHNFGHLLRGEQYTRTMNRIATQYFLEQILIDYGQEALRAALNAVEAHIEYYAAYRNLNSIREIHDRFMGNIDR